MGNKPRVDIGPISLSPSEKAQLEIIQLSHAPELREESMIGGRMTEEMRKENERKRAEYLKRKLAIIKKHGVVMQYLEPLLVKEKGLAQELAKVQQDIASLRELIPDERID